MRLPVGDENKRNCVHKIRKPLRNSAEVAADLGITLHQLSGYLSRDSSAPKTIMIKGRTFGVKNSWYDLTQMRAWWAARRA